MITQLTSVQLGTYAADVFLNVFLVLATSGSLLMSAFLFLSSVYYLLRCDTCSVSS